MSEPSTHSRFPSWLGIIVVVLLTLQLGIAWLQGGLLQRQHKDLLGLREDIQTLADSLDQNAWQDSSGEGLAPVRRLHRHGRPRIQRVRLIQESQPTPPPPSEDERAKKELESSRDSALKAVADARDVQSKLSIEENARKAEEKAKLQAAEHTWQKWGYAAFGVILVALVVRAWLRRRG